MKNRIFGAFDQVRAEKALKDKAAQALSGKIKDSAIKRSTISKRIALTFASLLVLLLLGGALTVTYNTPVTFIDVDVNPSIELSVNRFGRVIKANAYNADGDAVLEGVKVRHSPYAQAVELLLEEMFAAGYLNSDGLVSVSVQTSGSQMGDEIIAQLNSRVSSCLDSHSAIAALEVFPISADIRSSAHDNNVSPAKYLSILELMAVDPGTTFEGCAHSSVNEIREKIRESKGAGHHGGSSTHGDIGPDSTPNPSQNNGDAPSATPQDSHHGNSAPHAGGGNVYAPTPSENSDKTATPAPGGGHRHGHGSKHK